MFKTYKGKVILITGAGGSIGAELVRQLIPFEPKQLLLLDKDETLLFEINAEISEMDHEILIETLIGDIRDYKKMSLYFKSYKPEIVLHAAAYKHVPLLEMHPHEAILNNVFGTRIMLTHSANNDVEKFILISTDKAVKPTSVMGASKALAEKLMFNTYDGHMKCMAVRFGNVLGSRGSVIPIFERQIKNGGPVMVTDPEMTRYFMSIPESSQLVLQAGAMGNGGELYILKMGRPVKIIELAEKMIEVSMSGVGVKIIGTRSGEKIHEELYTDLEIAKSTDNDQIFIMDYHKDGEINIRQLESITDDIYLKSNGEIRDYLRSFIPDYIPLNPIDNTLGPYG